MGSLDTSGDLEDFDNIPPSYTDLPVVVRRVLKKIESAQLDRAKEEIAERLTIIRDRVNAALHHARLGKELDRQRGLKLRAPNHPEQIKERDALIDLITQFSGTNHHRKTILSNMWKWLLDSHQMLSEEMEDLEEEEDGKLTMEWIMNIDTKIQNSLAATQECIMKLSKLCNILFGFEKKEKPKAKQRGKEAWKWWREIRLDPKTALTLQELKPLSTPAMLAPNSEDLVKLSIDDMDAMVTDMAKSLPCKKAMNIAFRYVRHYVSNLYRAFKLRSDEYSEVENEIRKPDSFGNLAPQGTLVQELQHLRDQLKLIRRRAEQAEVNYTEARALNQKHEETIKTMRVKMEVMQQGSNKHLNFVAQSVTDSRRSSIVSLKKFELKKAKSAIKKYKDKPAFPEIRETGAGYKTDRRRSVISEVRKPRSMLLETTDIQRSETKEVIRAPSIRKERTKSEVVLEEKPSEEDIPKTDTIKLHPMYEMKSATILKSISAVTVSRINLDISRASSYVGFEKSESGEVALEILKDFETAIVYSLDQGMVAGKELTEDGQQKVEELLRTPEVRRLYHTIKEKVRESFEAAIRNLPFRVPEQALIDEGISARPSEDYFDGYLNIRQQALQPTAVVSPGQLPKAIPPLGKSLAVSAMDISSAQKENLEALTHMLRNSQDMRQMFSKGATEAVPELAEGHPLFSSPSPDIAAQREDVKKGLLSRPPTRMKERIHFKEPSFFAEQERKHHAEMSAKAYTISADFQRTNVKTLDQAMHQGVISTQLHSIATALIDQTRRSIALRLSFLFRKYIAIHRIQELRKSIQAEVQRMEERGEDVVDMNDFMDKLDQYNKFVLQNLETKQLLADQKRHGYLSRMSFLFTQLKSNTGLQLYKPYVASKDSNVTQRRFSSPIDQTFIIESGRPSHQGAPSTNVVIKQKVFGTPSTFPAEKRNIHLICSQSLVDGSLPIATKIPTIRTPSEFPMYPEYTQQPRIIPVPKQNEIIASFQGKIPFGQMLMDQFAGVIGEKMDLPTKHPLLLKKQKFPAELEQKLLRLSIALPARNNIQLMPQRHTNIKETDTMWSTGNVCEELQTVNLMPPVPQFLEIPTLLALDINASINKAFYSIQQRIQQNNERLRHKQS